LIALTERVEEEAEVVVRIGKFGSALTAG